MAREGHEKTRLTRLEAKMLTVVVARTSINDLSIAHAAVATNSGGITTAPPRGPDHRPKYNQPPRIIVVEFQPATVNFARLVNSNLNENHRDGIA
jgi:enolase